MAGAPNYVMRAGTGQFRVCNLILVSDIILRLAIWLLITMCCYSVTIQAIILVRGTQMDENSASNERNVIL